MLLRTAGLCRQRGATPFIRRATMSTVATRLARVAAPPDVRISTGTAGLLSGAGAPAAALRGTGKAATPAALLLGHATRLGRSRGATVRRRRTAERRRTARAADVPHRAALHEPRFLTADRAIAGTALGGARARSALDNLPAVIGFPAAAVAARLLFRISNATGRRRAVRGGRGQRGRTRFRCRGRTARRIARRRLDRLSVAALLLFLPFFPFAETQRQRIAQEQQRGPDRHDHAPAGSGKPPAHQVIEALRVHPAPPP